MPSVQNVDWDEIEHMVKTLSRKILNLSRTFHSITTLSRGGLIPSRLLADSLGIKKIYVDEKKISADSLIVDDIFDTGTSFDKIVAKVDDVSKLVFATLFARRGKKYPPQLVYAAQTIDDDYVVFPWDKFEFKRSL